MVWQADVYDDFGIKISDKSSFGQINSTYKSRY